MALRVTVELVGDARRAPGGHGVSAARGDALATVIVAVEQAAPPGWAAPIRPSSRRARAGMTFHDGPGGFG